MEPPDVSSEFAYEVAAEGRTMPVAGGGVLHVRRSGPALAFALECGRGDRAAADVVAACVEDLAASGAVPTELAARVFGPLPTHEDLLLGLERGCRAHGFVWRGAMASPGEEPGVQVEASGRVVATLPGARSGDVLFACGDAALQDAGFDVALRWLREAEALDVALSGTEVTGRQALLIPRKAFFGPVYTFLHEARVGAVIAMTARGLTRSITAALGGRVDAALDLGSWPLPDLAAWLKARGAMDDAALAATFNLGVGQILCVPPAQVDYVAGLLQAWNEPHWRVGSIVAGSGRVRTSGGLGAGAAQT